MPRGKRSLQLVSGIVYLRFARRELPRRVVERRRARDDAVISRRSPRVPRARRAQRSKLTIINEKRSRFVSLILCHRARCPTHDRRSVTLCVKFNEASRRLAKNLGKSSHDIL